MVLSSQENQLTVKMFEHVEALPKAQKDGTKEKYMVHNHNLIQGHFSIFTTNFQDYVVGAFLFVISDTILAYNKFVRKGGKTGSWYFAIMCTYYMAITFLALSAIAE